MTYRAAWLEDESPLDLEILGLDEDLDEEDEDWDDDDWDDEDEDDDEWDDDEEEDDEEDEDWEAVFDDVEPRRSRPTWD
jgi:hypothetical protein